LPTPGQFDARVGTAAAVVSVLCAVLLSATGVALAVPSIRAWLSGEAGAVSYVAGELIDLESGTFDSTPYTIILFSRASCRACQQSRSVMAALVSDVAGRSDVKVMLAVDVVGSGQLAEEEAFAREIGLDRSRLFQVETAGLRLRYVPTAVLTDATGKILLAREGLLTETDRVDVTRLIGPEASD
jgi:hypothetical protein